MTAIAVDIVTLFPEMFEAMNYGVVGRARTRGLYELRCHNPRAFADHARGYIDDAPYGGGAGMVMQAPPVLRAVRAAQAHCPDTRVVLLAPHGQPWTQKRAQTWFHKHPQTTLICGRYEGIDERVEALAVDDVISVGDYVLSGGELAAMVMIDSALRWVDGVVGDAASVEQESFATGLLDYPHYTRPEKVENLKVPGILKSGHHAAIQQWRLEQARLRTQQCRPDLLEKFSTNKELEE